MSRVTCHVSRVTCHMLLVTCNFFCFFLFGQSGEAYRWRVCYQRGLPRLVFSFHRDFTTAEIWVCVQTSHCQPGFKDAQVWRHWYSSKLTYTYVLFCRVIAGHHKGKRIVYVGVHARRGDRIKKWKDKKAFKWVNRGLTETIPNWAFYPQLDILSPIGHIIPIWGYQIPNWG